MEESHGRLKSFWTRCPFLVSHYMGEKPANILLDDLGWTFGSEALRLTTGAAGCREHDGRGGILGTACVTWPLKRNKQLLLSKSLEPPVTLFDGVSFFVLDPLGFAC